MAEVVVVDSDVLIDVGREVDEALYCLDHIERHSSPAISAVTHMELLVGCRNKTELRKLDRFLLRFQVVRLTESISDRSIQLLRRYLLSHGLLIADAVIAATALTLTMPLVTKNQRDYRFIDLASHVDQDVAIDEHDLSHALPTPPHAHGGPRRCCHADPVGRATSRRMFPLPTSVAWWLSERKVACNAHAGRR